MKKIIVIIPLLILGFWLFFKLSTTFQLNCRGDVCFGPRILVHTFARNKPLCSLVGGTYDTNIAPMRYPKKGCYVTSKLTCALRGGELKNHNDDWEGMLPPPYYFCGKDLK